MIDTQQYQEYIECTFNGFCKTVLYHAAINACRDLRRKQQHEVSLDYLREYHIEPTTTDEYFVVYDVPTVFSVRGETVIVESELLAKALLRLPEKRREILFLRFYLEYSDIEIGKMIGRCRSSINRRKNYALRLLRKEMEALQNEE